MRSKFTSICLAVGLVSTTYADVTLGPPWDVNWGVPVWPGPSGPIIVPNPPWLPPGSESLAVYVTPGNPTPLKWQDGILDMIGKPGTKLSFDLTMIASEWNGEITRVGGVTINSDAGWQQVDTPLSVIDKVTGLPASQDWTSLEGNKHRTFTFDLSSVTASGDWTQIYFSLLNPFGGAGAFYFDRVWLVYTPSNTPSAQSTYFLVAERPGSIFSNDSYVIALTNALHIAHARDLIVRGPAAAGSPIVVADIALGADGINRDLRSSDTRMWSWHVTHFTAFADATIEILDGSPGMVELNPQAWIANTGGEIGFWTYTVVAELPLSPRIDTVTLQGGQIELSLADLTPPFGVSVEASTHLASASWWPQTNFVPSTRTTNMLLPQQGDQCFYRVRTP